MKRFILILILSVFSSTAFMCASCVAPMGPRHGHVALAPPLPATVILVDPYYRYKGYYYYYDHDRWYYSQSRDGGWRDLPRKHYPKNVKYKGKKHKKGWEDDRGRGHGKDYDHDHDRKGDKDWDHHH